MNPVTNHQQTLDRDLIVMNTPTASRKALPAARMHIMAQGNSANLKGRRMHRIEMILAAAGIVVLLTLPAWSLTGGTPAPDPAPETPSNYDPGNDGGSDTTATPYVIQYYGFCCTWRDAPRYHTAAGRDPLQAALQCQARIMSYAGDLPQCSSATGARIDRADARAGE